MPVALMDVAAKSVTVLQPLPPQQQQPQTGGYRTTKATDSWRYLVDFGREIQGHVNFSFAGGAVGHNVTVRLGEVLRSDGDGVMWHSQSENIWSSTWTLPGRAATFVPHEYAEFRYAEVIGAPEAPDLARLNGWIVRYPLGEELPGIKSDDGVTGFVDEHNSLTTFTSSSLNLNAVWDLSRYTVIAGAIDLNTDSNTRQRDLCTLDAWLATEYQGGVAPASSCHLRRRVTQIM